MDSYTTNYLARYSGLRKYQLAFIAQDLVELRFLTFELEAPDANGTAFDYVEVYNGEGKVCRKKIIFAISSDSMMRIGSIPLPFQLFV